MAAFNRQLLDGMVIFTEVVTAGSFTAAANNTGYSTSLISKEINKLEERLGVRLLHRTTRTLSLTPEGELYFQQCQQIIQDAEQIENAISGKQVEPKGTLRVSCPVAFGLSRLRPVLAEYTERYPKINIELDLNDRKIDMISEGFDMLIRASRQLEDSSLISRQFMQSEAVTIASPDYLKKHGTPNTPQDLVNHRTISYSNIKNPNLWQFIDSDGKEHQVTVNSRVVTNSSEMELELCVAGQGITRLPRFNLHGELERGELVELFTDYENMPIGIYLVYPSRKHMSPKVRCFIDFIVETLGDK